MDSAKILKELSGFSGCRIYLCENKIGEIFVRKYSSKEEYNTRLEKQMIKQRLFSEKYGTRKISAPRVFNSGHDGNLFYFDMEYINGVTLIEHVQSSPPEELKNISKIILEILQIMRSSMENEKIITYSKICKKLNQISNSIQDADKKILEIIKNDLVNIPELQKTFCHGDLTLENIIYSRDKNKYYLIDFLDSFIENYWVDIVKLFQDLEGKWYLLRNPDIDKILMDVKIYFISEFIKTNLVEDYWKYHKSLLKLTFVRILPYASGEKYNQVKKIINSIN